jgi:hypothetical protein
MEVTAIAAKGIKKRVLPMRDLSKTSARIANPTTAKATP